MQTQPSIGKDEIGHLRTVCDEIFGRSNLLEVFIWQIEGNTENQEDITSVHEYVLAYARSKSRTQINTVLDPNLDDSSKLLRDFVENSVVKNGPANPASVITLPTGFPVEIEELHLPRNEFAAEFQEAVESDGGYIKRELRERFGAEYPIRLDDLDAEDGELVGACRVYSGWSSARKLNRFIETGFDPVVEPDGSRVRYFLSKGGVPTYRRENRHGHFVPSILRNMGTTERSSNELERMGVRFSYPKPVALIKYLLSLYVRKGDIILDSFAGSGTTGHAALELNREYSLDLRVILIELEASVARDTTAKRLRSVVAGYSARRGRRTVPVPGLGGGFRFCELGPTLFDVAGRIREEVGFEELARHVFFVETGEPLPEGALNGTPLLGVSNGTAVYLLYNGILRDRNPNGGNALTRGVLESLPPHDGPRVVYGTSRRVSPETLRRADVVFRQTPYEIRTR